MFLPVSKALKENVSLFIFMSLWQACGAALLGLGIWIIVEPYQLDLLAFLDNPLLQNSVYVIIAVGSFIIVVSGLGLFGACCHSQCMLGLVSPHQR